MNPNSKLGKVACRRETKFNESNKSRPLSKVVLQQRLRFSLVKKKEEVEMPLKSYAEKLLPKFDVFPREVRTRMQPPNFE